MALKTRSSTAVEKHSQEAADKCSQLDPRLTKEMVPLFVQIHHCGSVLAEVFFAMMISRVLYGSVPAPGTMVIFGILLACYLLPRDTGTSLGNGNGISWNPDRNFKIR